MPYCGNEDGRIYFEESGPADAPVLVLSHSLGSDVSLWDSQVAVWNDRFRVVRYDHRGHGRSAAPPFPWSLDDFGRDLLRLLEHLSLDRTHFAGVSLGGMVGLWLAQNGPERLNRLVVANTSAWTEDPTLLEGRIRLVESEGTGAIVGDVLDRWFTPAFHRDRSEVVERFRKGVLATSSESYAATSRAICKLDLREGLSTMDTPTLVVTGAEDRATPPAWGEAIAGAIPGARLHELAAAHLSNVESAAEFNELVASFLDQEKN